jgi:hypothetical protein
MNNVYSKINKDEHREYCNKLIRDYNLQNLDELKNFINRLLEKNVKNKKRVEKIKKLLLSGNIIKNLLISLEPMTLKYNNTNES